MTTNEEHISLVKAGEQLGVDFDSPKTLDSYLTYVRRLRDPSLRYFIPVLENSGIIPEVDDDKSNYDPDFDALLIRIGVMNTSIPNTMRGHFLVAFLRRHDMKIEGWEKLPRESQEDIVVYLQRYYSFQIFTNEGDRLSQKLIDDVIVPILATEDPEASGNIPENYDFVQHLGAFWGYSNYSLKLVIQGLVNDFFNQKIGSRQAAAIINLDQHRITDIARRHKWLFHKNDSGHWQFTRHNIMGFGRR